ncbi:hypothetical protein KMI_12g17970 [Encephalitozoon hellem]|nr:hypothetical protein KMI_12g17970 [Encephalitozoon hellem]
MLAVSVIGMIGLLGGLRGENPLVYEGECVSPSVNKEIKVSEERCKDMRERGEKFYKSVVNLYSLGLTESMKKCLDEHPSEKGQELYEVLVSENEVLQEKLERLREAVENSESSFEELKGLMTDAAEASFRTSNAMVMLSMEVGFNEMRDMQSGSPQASQ